MIATWFRRAALALAGAGLAALIAACGSGSVVSDLKPKRFLVVGDGFADVGQNGYRFTINDGSLNWVQQFASYYSLTVEPASAGGWAYAQGNARVDSPDPVSNAPSVRQQVDALLARDSFRQGDVMIVGGGIADIVAAVNATGTTDASTQTVRAAGKALAAQVQRVVNAGATHVVVVGVYDIGHTPWAASSGYDHNKISDLSNAFNDALLVELSDPKWGQNVLYFDAALFFNFIYNRPENYPVDNVKNAVCTTPDATTCTSGTLAAGADPARWLYADSLYLTPQMQRLFVSDGYLENAYSRFKGRW